MLSKKYLNSVKNLHAIMRKIIEGTAPEKFTTEHLKKIGFPSSNDRAILGLLKDLGFLTESGNPTQRYHDYRNASKSKQVLGEALKDAYPEIFHINEQPSQTDKAAITGLFKTTHNVNDTLAGFMSNTFFSLLDIADINGQSKPHKKDAEKGKKVEESASDEKTPGETNNGNRAKEIITNLRYNIEIHLPATKDIEVYNSIFKSLRQHLLDE
jgi:hypothetical protein